MSNTNHDASCECPMCRLETKAGIGILAGSVITIGAVAAYLYGTDLGRRQRKAMRSWMSDMRDETVEHLEDLQYVDKETYFDVVDDLVSRYKHRDEVDAVELVDFARDMKDHYHTIQRDIKEGKKSKGGSTKDKKSSTAKKNSSATKSRSVSSSKKKDK